MADLAPDRDSMDEELMGLDPVRIAAILAAVDAQDTKRLSDLMAPLHAADIADLLEQVSPSERRGILQLWSGGIDGEILSEIDDSIREEVIEFLPRDVLADAVRQLETDDVVDILEDLEQPQQDVILNALEDADRVAVQAAMAYPEGSAGRLMQREVVVAPEHWTVGEAIDFLRTADWLPDQFYHVILIDPRMKPQGYVTLGRLLSSRRDVRLRDGWAGLNRLTSGAAVLPDAAVDVFSFAAGQARFEARVEVAAVVVAAAIATIAVMMVMVVVVMMVVVSAAAVAVVVAAAVIGRDKVISGGRQCQQQSIYMISYFHEAVDVVVLAPVSPVDSVRRWRLVECGMIHIICMHVRCEVHSGMNVGVIFPCNSHYQ